MTVKIVINGFGRMGRLGLRAGWGREDIVVTQVNEIASDAAGSAHHCHRSGLAARLAR